MNAPKKQIFRLVVALVVVIVLCPQARGGEGGGSDYLQGTSGDWAVAAPSPAGFYLRNDFFYYDASVGPRPLGGGVAAGADQYVTASLTKLAFVPGFKLLGGSYSAAIVIPVVHADVTGSAITGGFSAFAGGQRTGLGDITLVPLSFNWTVAKNQYVTVSECIYAPTGGYDASRLINIGRNYWAFDTCIAYTYLNKTGQELSATAGVMANTENTATDYTSGTAFHLDWLVGQHLSEHLALGVIGYWYQQIGNDSGNIPGFLPAGFRGEGVGLGPAVLGSFPIGGKNINLIGKWIHDVEETNRFGGDMFMVSVAFKF